MDNAPEFTSLEKYLSQQRCSYAMSVTGTLHRDCVAHLRLAIKGWQSGEAFPADDIDFYHFTAASEGVRRDQSSLGKVRILNDPLRLREFEPQSQRNRLQCTRELCILFLR